ncbi:hypothetical protein ONZ45_g19567 [Pleurotus djamor]|nr:hypothetical protein ONZ45_g19567 [Pleurotus djamor]
MLSSLQSNLLLFGLLARAAPDPTASSMAAVASLGDDLMPGTTNGTLSLNITATTAVLNVPTLSNQSAVTNLFTDLASNNYNVSLVNGTRQLNATYDIWTSVCIPTEPSPRNDTLVILTHG